MQALSRRRIEVGQKVMKGRLVGDQDDRNKKETHWRREQAVGSGVEGGGVGEWRTLRNEAKRRRDPHDRLLETKAGWVREDGVHHNPSMSHVGRGGGGRQR